MPAVAKVEAPAKRLAIALGHPLRVDLVRLFMEETASPNELARLLGEPVGTVAYHVRVLEKAGYIELVSTAQRRGATEHFYRAIMRPSLSEEEWAALPRRTREEISCRVLQNFFGEAYAALEAGTFDSSTDRHLSWFLLNLDREGWAALATELMRTMERIQEIQAESDERRVESDESAVPVVAGMMAFERADKAGRGGVC